MNTEAVPASTTALPPLPADMSNITFSQAMYMRDVAVGSLMSYVECNAAEFAKDAVAKLKRIHAHLASLMAGEAMVQRPADAVLQ